MAVFLYMLQTLFALSQFPGSRRFLCAQRQCQEIQEQLLRSYLRQNRETTFGREHDFREIDDITGYRQHVPIRNYQEFLPYLHHIQTGQQGILTAEDVLSFHPTGGTTGTKLIPYTQTLKQEFQRALAPWLWDIFRNFPAIRRGKTYWTITPPGKRRETESQDIPAGFDEDASYFGWKGYFLSHLFAVPSWVTLLEQIENFQFLTLYFLLQARELRWMSIWSPTFFLVLLEQLDRNAEGLLSSIYEGGLKLPKPESLNIHLTDFPKPVRYETKKRARELEQILSLPESQRYRKIWPNLIFVSLWRDAYASHPAQQFATLFPDTHFQGKGVLATEGVVSIPCHAVSKQGGAGCLPAFTSHFLEFMAEDGETYCLWELQAGKQYEVILTTGGGFYRYAIGDLVSVEGFYEGLPLLKFIGRKGRTSDLVGEKLEECFVTHTLEQALAAYPIAFSFLLIAPEIEDQTRGYVVFIESSEDEERLLQLTQTLDRLFMRNVQYEVAIRLGQLIPLRLVKINRNGAAKYLQRCLANGQKLGDIKPLSFDTRTGWQDIFEETPETSL